MSLPIDTGRGTAAAIGVNPARARPRRARGTGFGVAAAAAAGFVALSCAASASTPATFDSQPEDLPLLTEEMAALDPLAAEARCRSFLTALYQRLRTHGATSAWEPVAGQAEPFDWVLEAVFTLPPASAGVRAADLAAGDLTRAYLDAFGPAALASALPDDPLYRNDKTICESVLGLAAD